MPTTRNQTGEKRLLILQALAAMLEVPHAEKITTAALARQVGVSEAALYRHFASKAQMYEGLIEFIETTLFGLIGKILNDQSTPAAQVEAILALLLSFSAKNRGMTRVLIGEALIHEDPRLQKRVGQLHSRIEAQLRQCLRLTPPELAGQPALQAETLMCLVVGRWWRFAKSGFRADPRGPFKLPSLLVRDTA
jgi:TetR/AcrR family transcriptional regulator